MGWGGKTMRKTWIFEVRKSDDIKGNAKGQTHTLLASLDSVTAKFCVFHSNCLRQIFIKLYYDQKILVTER